MAMAQGSVTIASAGSETIVAGLSASLYTALKASTVASLATFGQTLPPAGPQLAASLSGIANMANALGSTIVSYVQTNMQVKVAGTVAALQKTPNPNNPATATAASGADVTLPAGCIL